MLFSISLYHPAFLSQSSCWWPVTFVFKHSFLHLYMTTFYLPISKELHLMVHGHPVQVIKVNPYHTSAPKAFMNYSTNTETVWWWKITFQLTVPKKKFNVEAAVSWPVTRAFQVKYILFLCKNTHMPPPQHTHKIPMKRTVHSTAVTELHVSYITTSAHFSLVSYGL